MPAKWRMAKSLDKLLAQINAAYPNRSKASDGGIGDAAHSSRTSDHNPNSKGVVQARDFTHDPKNGLGGRQLADAILASRDKRVKYIISDGQIASGFGSAHPFGVWRKYTGKNAHRKHVHVSVRNEPEFYDDASAWSIPVAGATVKPTESDPLTIALSKGDTGRYVVDLQDNLSKLGYDVTASGEFDNATVSAVKAFQKEHGLLADGIAGIRTNTAIGDALRNAETRPKINEAKRAVAPVAQASAINMESVSTAAVSTTGSLALLRQGVEEAKETSYTLMELGPWVLLAIVVAGGGAWLLWQQYKQRQAAKAATEALDET